MKKEHSGLKYRGRPTLQCSYLLRSTWAFLTAKKVHLNINFPTFYPIARHSSTLFQRASIGKFSMQVTITLFTRVHLPFMADTWNYPRETFRSTIVQVLNPSVYPHEYFDSVVCLEHTFIYYTHFSQLVSRQWLSVIITSS